MEFIGKARLFGQRGEDARPAGQAKAGIGTARPVEFTDEDRARERRIDVLQAQLLAAKTPSMRRMRLSMLQSEIAARTPNAIAVLEARKGLA